MFHSKTIIFMLLNNINPYALVTSFVPADSIVLEERKEYRKPPIELSESSPLNQKIINELESLIEYVPPKRLGRALRNMLLVYMSYEQDKISSEFDDLILDLYHLFNFLDTVSDEIENNDL